MFFSKKLTLPDSIMTIGKFAFQGCKIDNFYIGQNAVNIDRKAFAGMDTDTLTLTIDVRSKFRGEVADMMGSKKISEFKDYFQDGPQNIIIKFVGTEERDKHTQAVNNILNHHGRAHSTVF